MKSYQYRAENKLGIPVYGIRKAESEEELREQLAQLRLQLISCEALNWRRDKESQSISNRLQQLQIGGRVREALLTGMPAHEAVRALAAEPLESPLLLMMPWLTFTGIGAGLLLLAISWMIPISRQLLWTIFTIGFAGLPVLWITLSVVTRS
ncbi:MAG: hypothetical protein KDA85_07840, partial [Planctomycetaceae bacterium]|nr:hypothetical protein [Planctomycetaceae bacterium]